nr:sensor domain-containing protein [Microthrixaceae bacterium]
QLMRDSGYLLLSLPIGIITFTVAVAGWSTAISTLLTFIGVPVAVLTIGALRLLSRAERHRTAIVLGEPVAEHYKVDLPLHRDPGTEP